MNFDKNIAKEWMCVSCESSMDFTPPLAEDIKCNYCGQGYPVVNGIPVIINESKSIFRFADFTDKKNLFFDISKKGNLISTISRVIPSLGGNNLGKRNFKFLESYLIANSPQSPPRVLVVGGSIIGEGMEDFVNSKQLEIVEADVSFGPRSKIIFDAHSIPYKNESFDCVIAQAVLEHVIDPAKCVQEIYRVLKPSGVVYAETPFMQQVHGGPYDFTRFTRSGHRQLFFHFQELRSGSAAGSGTSMAWAYQYFLLALFGYTHTLRLMIKFFARITGFWMKYFDYLTMLNKYDDDGASGFYFIGTKSAEPLASKEIINYYFQTKIK